ncbi:MAG: diacylglycerol/lipid kinase family protein [Candidatus Aminicenantales bacterium]
MKTMLLVNPVAGHGKGKKCFRRLESRLLREIPGLEVRFSEYPGHVVELSREAARCGIPRILCLGGDGTLYETVNGLRTGTDPDRAAAVQVGLIPAGTGNSFLRDFGVISADQALEAIGAGRSRLVDLVEFECLSRGRLERRWSVNILGVGLIADILKLTNEKLKPLGALGYSLAVLLRLARGMNNRIDIEADGRAWSVRDSALVISNSKYTGGGMMIAPQADAQDGRADLVIFREVNRREIVQIFRGVFSGSHIRHPKVDMIPAASLAILGNPPLRVMADGELVGETPLRAVVLPRALTILA